MGQPTLSMTSKARGILPRNIEINPREHVIAVTSRSWVQL